MEAQAATQNDFDHHPEHAIEEGPTESKEQAFIRLAERRVDKALKVLAQIGNLSNRASYDYQPEDAEAISGALQAALDEAMSRFRPRHQREGFKLR